MEIAKLINSFNAAIDEKRYADAVNMVTENGLTFDEMVRNGETFLHIAVKKSDVHFKQKKEDDLELFKLIADTGANFCTQDNEGNNVLMYLLTCRDSGFEEDLETNKYISNDYVIRDIAGFASKEIFEQKDNKGNTALHYAVSKERYHLIDIAASKGADLNISGAGGVTILHILMQKRDVNEAFRIVKMGANPLLTDDNGRNIMHFLLEHKLDNLLTYQIKKVRYPSFKHIPEPEKLELAKFVEILDKMEKSGVMYSKNPEGHTAVYYMLSHNDAGLIDYFIENCFDKLEEDEQRDLKDKMEELAGPDYYSTFCYAKYRLLEHEGEKVSLMKDYDFWISCSENVYQAYRESKVIFRESEKRKKQFFLRQAIERLCKDRGNDDVILGFIKTCVNEDVDCPEMICELQKKNINVDEIYDDDGYNVIEHLLRNNYNRISIVQYLPIMNDLGVNIFDRNTENRSQFYEHLTDRYRNLIDADVISEEIIKLAELFPPEDFTTADTDGLTAAMYAASMKDGRLLKMMIEKGIDVNESGRGKNSGITPLHIACLNERLDNIYALLDAGADPDAADSFDNTCAHYVFMDKKAVWNMEVRTLYDCNLEIDSFKSYDEDLCEKRLEGRMKILNKLTNLDTSNYKGYTPFMLLMKNDYEAERLFDYFIERGVDINAYESEFGNTALHYYIEESKNNSLIGEFIKNGADINIQNNYGETPIMMAMQKNKFNVFIKLLKAGADCSIANNLGVTPVSYATEHEMANYFRQFSEEQINTASFINGMQDDDYDDDDYDDDEDEDEEDKNDDYEDDDEKTEEEIYREVCVKQFGEKGYKIAEYMCKISKMNEMGVNESNMKEYQELVEKYRGLLDM